VLKKLSLSVVLAFWGHYCYSDSITPYYGYTGNAAATGNSWNMDNVFPTPPGLDVNAVIYNYTIRKQTEDSVTVNVQNENAQGTGYIFRETDEWKPGSLDGTQINKVIGLPNVPREYWGDGSIEVTGNGSVEDPNVVYSYRVDPCYDPQYDPNCPGYQVQMPDIPEVDLTNLYDATQDENIDLDAKVDEDLIEKEESDEKSDEQKEKEKEEEEKDSKDRLEKALAEANNSALFAEALANSIILDSMNQAMNITSYYNATIPGGAYNDSVVLVDKDIPENRNGLRNGLAQQLLHEKMVDMQYGR
jgi:hypothetical protein